MNPFVHVNDMESDYFPCLKCVHLMKKSKASNMIERKFQPLIFSTFLHEIEHTIGVLSSSAFDEILKNLC
jgi:hypothetical protein